MTSEKNFTIDDVEIIQHEVAFKGYFQIESYQVKYRLFSGEWGPKVTRELFERGDAVVVLLFDPEREAVVLVEQFRIGALRDQKSPWLIELVAGIIEPNETHETVAQREIKEEANLVCCNLERIYQYWVSPGGSSEQSSLYIAQVDSGEANGVHGLLHEGENIRVCVIDAKEAFALVKSGRINNAAAIIALQWLALNYDIIREKWL